MSVAIRSGFGIAALLGAIAASAAAPGGAGLRVLAPLEEPAAVAVAADGTLFIAEAAAHRVSAFDATGRLLRRWGRFGRGAGEFDHPRGIAAGDDGLVYVADTGNQRVEVFTAAGRFVRAWGSPGTADGAFEEPRGIAAAAGRVAVADARTHRVQVFDAEGRLISFVWKHGNLPGALDRPVDVALEPSGALLVVDQGNSRVQRFDADGRLTAAWGGRGRAGVLTLEPGGMSVAHDVVLVADALGGRIVAASESGDSMGEWIVPGLDAVDDVAWLGDAIGIVACDALAGRCVIADALARLTPADVAPPRGPAHRGYAAGGEGNRLVLASRETGVTALIDLAPPAPGLLVTLGGPGHERLEFARPLGFAYDASADTVLIADTGNARFQQLRLARAADDPRRYDPAGTRFERGIAFDDAEALYADPGRWTAEPAGLEPGPFVVDDRGRVIVLDDVAHRVVVLDREFGFVTTWGGAGDEDGRFRSVRALAIDRDAGVVYVLDDSRRRVQAFDLEGRLRAAWGSRALFDDPVGLAVAHDGTVLVLDRAAARVTRFDPAGRVLATWGRRGAGRAQFDHPEALHVDGRGRVVVIDSGNARVQVLTASGRFEREFALDVSALAAGTVPDRAGATKGPAPLPGCRYGSVTAAGTYAVCWTTEPATIPTGEPFGADVSVIDTRTGAPARGVVLDVDATMPEHRHGLTLKPTVRSLTPTALELPPGHGAIGDGAFRVRGLLCHMPGLWRLHADVTHGAITERVDVDVVLE